ncbi:SMP-30/gluconolactonase/LRE family protein [Flavobacterium rhamnosiphilum]|uniref:SMP-30/gluconolactonase/LRE family protein n=2 Tax=Flavobacterium rhamnosiphilum TaxID=2541724 RepID=A0A4R5F9A5_9FLAO|nr:SMP-30/gluconolactonase/LRE family protein [Flavobacterium rhamnosiphilum]
MNKKMTMETWKALPLCKTELLLGEGAHWHSAWGKFLYVDIEGKKVGCIDPITKITEEKNVGERIGTVVPADNGSLVLALESSIVSLNFDTGEQKELIKIEVEKPNNRSNDGKCDALGRLWIGTMHEEAKGAEGALYCFDGKSLIEKMSNRKVSNGICWSKDNKTMYYIDSFDYNIKRYDFDLTNGTISNESVIVEVTEPGFTPDGMTIDEEGMLWVAMWGGRCVNRYNAFTGELVGKVEVDAPHVTSCAFGGNGMQQLLITTARVGLDEEQLLQYPDSGSLFIVDVGIRGMEMHQFALQH